MRLPRLCALALLVLGTSACSEDTDPLRSGDGGSGPSEPQDFGTPDLYLPPPPDFGVDDRGQPEAGPTDGPVADSGEDGGVIVCGGLVGARCPSNEYYCDFATNSCGATDEQGVCVRRPEGCTDELDPVCACDGMVYTNPCEAAAAGWDLNHDGCPAPPGQYSCGPRFCLLGPFYCQVQRSDVVGWPDEFQCIETPPACNGPARCECLGDELCGDTCVIQLGGPRTICQGG